MTTRIIRFTVRGAALAVLLSATMRPQTAGPPASRNSKIAALVSFRVQRAAATEDNVAALTYETWLIVRDEAGVHVAAKLPDVIVPRKTGFWRIGVVPTCQITPPSKDNPGDHGNIHTEAIEYAVPIDQLPQVGLTDPPCGAKTAARMLDPARDANAEDETKETDPTECGFENEWLEGVLPDLISVAMHTGQSDACEPRGFHWDDFRWVRRIDKPADPYTADGKVALGEIFGPTGERAWKKAIRASLHALSGDGCSGNESVDDQADITDWYFTHRSGAWRVQGFIQIGNGGCQPEGDTGLQMPQRLTTDSPLPSWLAATVKQQSTADRVFDGWVSPDGSVLLREQMDASPGTAAYRVHEADAVELVNDKIGRRLLALPAQKIIMVQWASGRFVDQWVSVLGARAKALPAPVVKVIAHSE